MFDKWYTSVHVVESPEELDTLGSFAKFVNGGFVDESASVAGVMDGVDSADELTGSSGVEAHVVVVTVFESVVVLEVRGYNWDCFCEW